MSTAHAAPEADVLIVGAGVAGVSCALWLSSLGVGFEWIDASGQVGGTLGRVYHAIANYPGAVFRDGPELAARLQTQVDACGLTLRAGRIEHLGLGGRIACIDGVERRFRYVVLATGTTPRRLRLPGEEALEASRVFVSTHHLKPQAAGRRILVVGGGDGAFEGALLLADAGAASVALVHRSRTVRARRGFRAQVSASPAIEVRLDTRVMSLAEQHGGDLRVGLETRGRLEHVDVDFVVRKIGVEPHLPPLDGELARVVGGYVKVDPAGRTSAPGVFAAGDVASPHFQCVANAAAQGAQVAVAIAAVLLA